MEKPHDIVVNEATKQVVNIRERGCTKYYQAKFENDANLLKTAISLFRRGANFPSPNVSALVRALINKNLVVSLSCEQKWIADQKIPSDVHKDSFFERLGEVANAYHQSVNHASVCDEFPITELWIKAIDKIFQDFSSQAVALVSLINKMPEQSPLENALFRVSKLLDFLKPEYRLSLLLRAQVRFRVADVLLKGSVIATERKEHVNATSLVQNADSQISYLDDAICEAVKHQEYIPHEEMDVDGLKQQIEYQKCRAISAQKIVVGYDMVNKVQNNFSESLDEDGFILMALDAFKEATVLAGEKSLEQEAQACARLGFIYRCFKSVRDTSKSNVYYGQSFTILQSLGLHCFIGVDWAQDVTAQRARIQRDAAKQADQRMSPILEKYKELLASIRAKMTSDGNEKEGVLFLYEIYPPKGKQAAPKTKLNDDLKSAIKTALLHYHPDRNSEEKYGFDNFVICLEITKMLNLMYGRQFKK